MRPKLLTINTYLTNFNFQESWAGCGIDKDIETGKNYFFVQTALPKSFYDIDSINPFFNPFLIQQVEDIPDQVHIKFELFSIGKVGEIDAFIFKPWVLNVDNPYLFPLLEGFNLFIPSTLFYNLIERSLFAEQISKNDFIYTSVLRDIPSNAFQRFGLDQEHIPKVIKTNKLELLKIDQVNESEILTFYASNWADIPPNIRGKYFEPLLNTWFRITLRKDNKHWYKIAGLFKKTVGFFRLYTSEKSFTGGMSLEYVVDKNYRKKGYALQAANGLINYLKDYSCAISLGAEVDDSNDFSKRILKRLGFREIKPVPFASDNYELLLFDKLISLEEKFNKGDIDVSILE
jgi:RimJ/RimL family protein N-acetyltransferase